MRRIFVLLAALAGPTELLCAEPTALRCQPLGDSEYWIQSVHVDVAAKKVRLQVRNESAERIVGLLYVGPEQFGGRTYHFNWNVEGTDPPILNMFKLFRSLDGWRLIDVGTEEHEGGLALKALGASQAMKCR